MAKQYTVCEDDAGKTVTIEMTVTGNDILTSYYDSHGCLINETLTEVIFEITAGGSADESFHVWYKYKLESYEDGVLVYESSDPPDGGILASETFPAGVTSFTTNILKQRVRTCTS